MVMVGFYPSAEVQSAVPDNRAESINSSVLNKIILITFQLNHLTITFI